MSIEENNGVIITDNYDLKEFQVVRREFFSHKCQPAVIFRYDYMYFNMACVRKLSFSNYIQLLVNPKEKKLLIKNCDEEAKDSVKWFNKRIKNDKEIITNRVIKCNIFSGKIYDLMKWSPSNKYKIQGTLIKTPLEIYMVFNLEEIEIYIPDSKDENGFPLKMKKRPFYPEDWKNSFGLPVEEHDGYLNIGYLDDYAKFDVIHEKKKRNLKKQENNESINQISLFENINEISNLKGENKENE